MHVLTKIFIVLVSLLAVLLVPLVVVYANNENSFKARYQEAEARAATANQALITAQASAGAEASRRDAQIGQLETELRQAQNEKSAADVAVRQLESQLAVSNSTQASMVADVRTIRAAIEAGHQLTESLVSEVRDLRKTAVVIEQQKVELDEALRDVTSQLEVAEQARRALAEELARVKEEHSQALTDLGKAIAQGFNPSGDVRAGALSQGIAPDKSLTATIVRVDRNSGQVLAEIDAGSRDGVKVGWNMSIGSGGTFIANLRIVDVDVNRATGVVSLESRDRGSVQVGQSAHARAGQS